MKRGSYFTQSTIEEKTSQWMNTLRELGLIKDSKLNIQSSGLIVLDMQNYFCSPDSHAYIPSVNAIIPRIGELINFMRQNKRPVVITRHSDNCVSGMMEEWWRGAIKSGTLQHKLIDDLSIEEKDNIIDKSTYDAFWQTDLEEILNKTNTTQVLVTGVMTHLCCETTARVAFVRGFQPYLVVDGTATYNEEFHFSSLLNLAHGFAKIIHSKDILDLQAP